MHAHTCMCIQFFLFSSRNLVNSNEHETWRRFLYYQTLMMLLTSPHFNDFTRSFLNNSHFPSWFMRFHLNESVIATHFLLMLEKINTLLFFYIKAWNSLFRLTACINSHLSVIYINKLDKYFRKYFMWSDLHFETLRISYKRGNQRGTKCRACGTVRFARQNGQR